MTKYIIKSFGMELGKIGSEFLIEERFIIVNCDEAVLLSRCS